MALEEENELAHRVIGFAIEIHKSIGPGLHPEAYRACLLYELEQAGIPAESQKKVPVSYKNLTLEAGFTIDILVDGKLMVMIENSETIAEFHVQRLLRFLRHSNYKLGLLINFNSALLKDGIRRVTNNKLIEKLMAGTAVSES